MSTIGPVGRGGPGAGGSIQQIMQMRQQIITRNDLLRQLHAPASPTGEVQGGQAPAAAAGPAPGFAQSLEAALDKVNGVQQQSDQLSEAYQRGEVTDVAKVMLARQEAGVAFEATLQVRNKLLTAYQDIMRMGV